MAKETFPCRLIGGPADGHVIDISRNTDVITVAFEEMDTGPPLAENEHRVPKVNSRHDYFVVGPKTSMTASDLVAVHKDQAETFMQKLAAIGAHRPTETEKTGGSDE